jgi:hypothetical protein
MISCQKNVIANFDIHIENSDFYDYRQHDLYKIEVYKDNKVFKILEPEEVAFSLDPNIKLDSIQEGEYSFVYESIFGEKIKKKIKVDDSKTYRISINPDLLIKKNKKSIFGNLKNSEAKLVFESRGCFHQKKDSIEMVNRDNKYYIRKKNGSLKPIDKTIWAYFVKTENKIREIPKNGGCTTRDDYIFYHKGKSDTINDGTCEFSIWFSLKDYMKNNKLQ